MTATQGTKIGERQGELALRLAEYAPLLKDESFSEEREWRLISNPMARVDRIKSRPGLSMIIPYLPFPLKLGTQQMQVGRIVVGPSPHMELSIKSVKSFLELKVWRMLRLSPPFLIEIGNLW